MKSVDVKLRRGLQGLFKIMWREFYCSQEWALWSWLGILVISAGSWYQVHLDVRINSWFGDFYDLLQKALEKKGDVSREEIYGFIFTFSQIAAIYIVVAVLLAFFTKHWTFRWRQAMNNYYMYHWPRLRRIEGASQRVQEDTRRFAEMVEGIGATFLQSLLTLLAFLPILLQLSENVNELPLIGEVPHAMVSFLYLFGEALRFYVFFIFLFLLEFNFVFFAIDVFRITSDFMSEELGRPFSSFKGRKGFKKGYPKKRLSVKEKKNFKTCALYTAWIAFSGEADHRLGALWNRWPGTHWSSIAWARVPKPVGGSGLSKGPRRRKWWLLKRDQGTKGLGRAMGELPRDGVNLKEFCVWTDDIWCSFVSLRTQLFSKAVPQESGQCKWLS